MKLLTIQGLFHLKQKIDGFFLHKAESESVTGIKTFETDPLFDDDKRLIDQLFEGNLIFLDVNDGERIGSTRVTDTSNLYYDLETAPAVEGYDFVTMEYDPLTEKYNLWYIPLTNPVVSSKSQMCSYIANGTIPNTKNLTDIGFSNLNNNSSITEIPPIYTKNAQYLNFNDCKYITKFYPFDCTNVNEGGLMFQGCLGITEAPKIIGAISGSCYAMFSNCTNLVSATGIDFSRITSAKMLFSECTSLTNVELEVSSATTTASMFKNCTSLITVPDLDTRSLTSLSSMFEGCSSLEVIEGLNLTNLEKSSWAVDIFKGCTSLREVHIDFGNNSNSVLNTLFNGLTFGANQMINLYVKNIPQSVRTAIENNYGDHVTIIDEV